MAAVFVVCGAILIWKLVPEPGFVPVLVGAAVLTVLGGLDDAYSLSVSWRLLVQGAVALGLILALPQDFQVLPGILPLVAERILLAPELAQVMTAAEQRFCAEVFGPWLTMMGYDPAVEVVGDPPGVALHLTALALGGEDRAGRRVSL